MCFFLFFLVKQEWLFVTNMQCFTYCEILFWLNGNFYLKNNDSSHKLQMFYNGKHIDGSRSGLEKCPIIQKVSNKYPLLVKITQYDYYICIYVKIKWLLSVKQNICKIRKVHLVISKIKKQFHFLICKKQYQYYVLLSKSIPVKPAVMNITMFARTCGVDITFFLLVNASFGHGV